MKKIQQPKKQPEIIRKRILEQAIILAAQKGVAGVSIQTIATEVGITKGGVFHHFSNKQILIEAMINEILLHLDQWIEAVIQADNTEYGKFTRAYIQSAFTDNINGLASPWSALSMTMISDPTFNKIWDKWLKNRLTQHIETDGHPDLELVRLATDGLWLQTITGIFDENHHLKLKNNLFNRTYLR